MLPYTTEINVIKIVNDKLKESGAFKKIEVDLYFSDFDLSGSSPVVINQEKVAKLKEVIKDDEDFVYLFAKFPYLVDPDNIDNEFGGKMSFYPYYFFDMKAFASFKGVSSVSQIILFAEVDGKMTAGMSNFPEWYTGALFTAMSTDPTKCISLKFKVEN